jgi:hypothetical protein
MCMLSSNTAFIPFLLRVNAISAPFFLTLNGIYFRPLVESLRSGRSCPRRHSSLGGGGDQFSRLESQKTYLHTYAVFWMPYNIQDARTHNTFFILNIWYVSFCYCSFASISKNPWDRPRLAVPPTSVQVPIRYSYVCLSRKCKAIPVTDRGGPWGCETSRLPSFV